MVQFGRFWQLAIEDCVFISWLKFDLFRLSWLGYDDVKEEKNVHVRLKEEANSKVKILECLYCATKQRETGAVRGKGVKREGGKADKERNAAEESGMSIWGSSLCPGLAQVESGKHALERRMIAFHFTERYHQKGRERGHISTNFKNFTDAEIFHLPT